MRKQQPYYLLDSKDPYQTIEPMSFKDRAIEVGGFIAVVAALTLTISV